MSRTQATRRSAWLWFWVGLLFASITGLVLIAMNAGDRKCTAAAPQHGAVSLPARSLGAPRQTFIRHFVGRVVFELEF